MLSKGFKNEKNEFKNPKSAFKNLKNGREGEIDLLLWVRSCNIIKINYYQSLQTV